MDGVSAHDVIEHRDDLAHLDDGNFWAIAISYEGAISATSFATIVRQEFPSTSWTPLSSQWSSSLSREQYCAYVEDIRAGIARGDLYQANACRVLQTTFDGSLEGLFSQILTSNPAPYSAYLRNQSVEIASASPELFLRREGRTVLTSPIKGTRAHNSEEFGVKDSAENIMIVDLMRNDLGQICEEVTTPQLLREESHPGLIHLVSDVQGRLKADLNWSQILPPLLPAGSISGAPKISALNAIANHEESRDIYCGVIGWVHGDRALFNVAIRTFWRRGDVLSFGTGAGITWNSDPESEWNETELKAARLLEICGGSK